MKHAIYNSKHARQSPQAFISINTYAHDADLEQGQPKPQAQPRTTASISWLQLLTNMNVKILGDQQFSIHDTAIYIHLCVRPMVAWKRPSCQKCRPKAGGVNWNLQQYHLVELVGCIIMCSTNLSSNPIVANQRTEQEGRSVHLEC
eukprot:1131808-Pleurochrysis_carterae.AAC.3